MSKIIYEELHNIFVSDPYNLQEYIDVNYGEYLTAINMDSYRIELNRDQFKIIFLIRGVYYTYDLFYFSYFILDLEKMRKITIDIIIK